jgi:glycosyltransferase involved in cell wall biosynthesis
VANTARGLKSLHITNAWHEESGGIATYYRALAAEAKRRGRSLALLVPGAEDGFVQEGCVRIHTVKAGPSPFNAKYRLIMPNVFPGVNRRVLEILREEDPDLLETCDKYSLHYLSGLLRKGWLPDYEKRPVLVGLSCERMDDNLAIYLSSSAWGKAFARWYMKWVYFGFFDHHITVSEYTVEELRLAGRGHVRNRGIWVRGMGVDLDTFSPAHRKPSIREKHLGLVQGNPNTKLLLYVGRLAPEKNLNLLVETLALLPSGYRLLMAGDGICRTALEQTLARRLPGRAVFLGHCRDRQELAGIYANADVFVHPNPREPFGIAPLEAMASGLPLVAPNSGGITTYANTANAWLADPQPAAFAAAIRNVMEDSDRDQKVARALLTAQAYQWNSVASRYLDLYDRLALGETVESPEYQSTRGNWLGQEV